MRLVDLHCDWLRQYATETTLYEGSLYPEIPGRVGRLDGYLLGTSLAVLACGRKPEDWSRQADPWEALGLMIARYEAEFAGRILRDARDVARWRSLPADGLCWGVLGVAGFDFLVRQADDLDRLPALFERGVRVFQAVADDGGVLGGSASPGDDRGLTDLGRAFLARVAELARDGESRPRPILDLAGMNAMTISETLRSYDDADVNRANLPLALLPDGRLSGAPRWFVPGRAEPGGIPIPRRSRRPDARLARLRDAGRVPASHRSGRRTPVRGSAGVRRDRHRQRPPGSRADGAGIRVGPRRHAAAGTGLRSRDSGGHRGVSCTIVAPANGRPRAGNRERAGRWASDAVALMRFRPTAEMADCPAGRVTSAD